MCFSISGFSSGGMDYGMVGGKEAGTESRFKQWTSMMEVPSVATQEANMHKNGKTHRASWPGTLPILRGLDTGSCKLILKHRCSAFS